MLSADNLKNLKNTLFAGRYNLLLGSGISLDSRDNQGNFLLSAGSLQNEIASLKNVKNSWPLTRLYQLLNQSEVERLLTIPYSQCQPGDTVNKIPNFVWQQIFTFNIDDALENAYIANSKAAQTAKTVNFDEPYLTVSSRAEVPIIHLHGYANQPEKGYVFAQTEYAQVSRSMNPWMHVLSEILATEPFIIAGTSLSEPDLEYYLSFRSKTTPRLDRGPSILVEPFPDAVTRNDCERHGVVLVEATLLDFLKWLNIQLGTPPTLETLTVPSTEGLFSSALSALNKISFFTSFELVQPVVATHIDGTLSGFYLGQQPTWNDLASSIDIPIEDELRLTYSAKEFLDGGVTPSKALVITGEPGTGKTTSLRRVAYDLALEGKVIFVLKSHAAIDIAEVTRCLLALERRCVLLIDNFAENANAVRSLLEMSELTGTFLVMGCDRTYRKSHIDNSLEGLEFSYFEIETWGEQNYSRLIERFRKMGLAANPKALSKPKEMARDLYGEHVAIATCRILNNFQPIDTIVRSIWDHADNDSRLSYIVAAICEYCHSSGVYYPILQRAFNGKQLADQLSNAHALPLCYTSDDDDYVVPLNATIGERVLMFACINHRELVFEAYVSLANALAPYVNRRTIKAQTPEARLSGRLFHARDVVSRLLEDDAERFYIAVKEKWEWNSRYWEHRAILIADRDIETAIQYARHAVAIEQHPFPWTTLAALLLRKLDVEVDRDTIFSEAFDLLIKTLNFDVARLRRQSRHAYLSLFQGTVKYLDFGGKLSASSRSEILSWVYDARALFSKMDQMTQTIAELERRI